MRATHMLITGLVAGLEIVPLPGSALAQDAPGIDLTGNWTFQVTTDAGSGTPGVVLKQQGDSLSGRYSSEFFGEAEIRGKVVGREFTLELTVQAEGQSLAVVYRGTIESPDDLKGTVTFGSLGSGTFTAKRRPPSLSRASPRDAPYTLPPKLSLNLSLKLKLKLSSQTLPLPLPFRSI